MKFLKVGAAIALFAVLITGRQALAADRPAQPTTIVLVHGAFAGSSSWNAVVRQLQADGYRVVAAANPLRGLASDGDYVARIVKSIEGPEIGRAHV